MRFGACSHFSARRIVPDCDAFADSTPGWDRDRIEHLVLRAWIDGSRAQADHHHFKNDRIHSWNGHYE
jgi:hypothetical protein